MCTLTSIKGIRTTSYYFLPESCIFGVINFIFSWKLYKCFSKLYETKMNTKKKLFLRPWHICFKKQKIRLFPPLKIMWELFICNISTARRGQKYHRASSSQIPLIVRVQITLSRYTRWFQRLVWCTESRHRNARQ